MQGRKVLIKTAAELLIGKSFCVYLYGAGAIYEPRRSLLVLQVDLQGLKNDIPPRQAILEGHGIQIIRKHLADGTGLPYQILSSASK